MATEAPVAPLTCQRHLFSIPEDIHFFNNAFISPILKSSELAIEEAIEDRRDPSRITMAMFFDNSDRNRVVLGKLLSTASPNQIALCTAISYPMAIALRETPVASNQNVVVLEGDFPSMIYPWRTACRKTGAEFRVVASPRGSGRAEAWNAKLLDAIDSSTAAVAISHVHYGDGTLFDLGPLSQKARSLGVPVYVDGSQSAGIVPINLQETPVDVFAGVAYKWLLGPYGLGYAYYSARFYDCEPLESTWLTREGNEDFSKLSAYNEKFRPEAVRFDVGEASSLMLTPHMESGVQQVLAWGVERIQAYVRGLKDLLISELDGAVGEIPNGVYNAPHCATLPFADPEELTRVHMALREAGIHTSKRDGFLRISLHLYNDADEMRLLASKMKTLLG